MEWLLLVPAAAGLALAGAFVVGTVRRTRRAVERGRRRVQPAKARVLGVRGLVDPTSAARRDLVRDVLQARQAYDLAVRDGRPVAELDGTVRGLERLSRSLDTDLRMGRSVDDEIARTRAAARAVVEACGAVPGRAGLLDEVSDAAERARLIAEARRQLPG